MKLLEKLRKVMKSLTGPVSPTTPRVVPETVANTASVNAPVSSASVFAGHSPMAPGRSGERQKQGESGLIAKLRREFEEYEPSRQRDAVPELTPGEIARVLETKYPGLWRLCYPRVYKNLPGYPSIKNIAVDLASTLVAALDGRVPIHTRRTYWPSAVSVARLISQKVPLFHVAADLLTAVRQTTPPKNVEWAEMHLPFENAVFVLPRGSVRHQMYGDVHYVWYSRRRKGEVIHFPGVEWTYTVAEDAFQIKAGLTSGQEQREFQLLLTKEREPVLNFLDLAELTTDTQHPGEPLGTKERPFVPAMLTLVFGILLVMLERPQLVEAGERSGKNKKKRGTEFWSPNIIGRRYQICGKGSGAGSGVSPRMHWRRGHWRAQAYGPGRALRHDRWIEPTLVAADENERSKKVASVRQPSACNENPPVATTTIKDASS